MAQRASSDPFLRQFFEPTAVTPASLFGMDFWITSGVFFALWSGILVFAFTARLRRGLTHRIHDLADEISQTRTSRGLFPKLEDACRTIERQRTRLETLSESVVEIRNGLASATGLGTQHEPAAAPAEPTAG